ncbi:MAG: SDR family oxidoreductase [Propionicimonas sp.]|nr:SDR family oxidoreductase [Propionicimonas sp.]
MKSTQSQLEGLTVVVAGGNGGLGRVLALGLSERGAQVVVADMVERSDSPFPQVPLNVTDRESVAACIAQIAERYGRIDGLLNAVGITYSMPFLDAVGNTWERVIAVNLVGAFNLCQAVAQSMRANAIINKCRGSIVNIASLCSQTGCQDVSAYNASKAGILGLTRSMAVDLAPYGIRSNAILPGVFITDLNADRMIGTARGDAVLARTPAGRFGEAEEIIPAVAMLLSREASFINGAEIPIDGGFLSVGISESLAGVLQ